MGQAAGYHPVLIEVTHSLPFLQATKRVLSKYARSGLVVGIESFPLAKGVFWRKIVDYCKKQGMKVVFLDSAYAHNILEQFEKQPRPRSEKEFIKEHYIQDILREKFMLRRIFRERPQIILSGRAHGYFRFRQELKLQRIHEIGKKKFPFPESPDFYLRERLERFELNRQRRARRLGRT